MQQGLHTWDYVVFLIYFLVVAGYGYWVYRQKKSQEINSQDFFLAEGSLTWWAIGASLIASNISAEQFIGMSGSGFAMGLAIATYEWMAAATLLVVAIFFMPIYLRNRIFTMPQFLTRRYDKTVSTVMAVFWLLVYVFVNLASILYLGALPLQTILGLEGLLGQSMDTAAASQLSFFLCTLGLTLFAIFITLGGMKVIGYTDVIQVFFLTIGGLATTYLALNLIAENFGGHSWLAGFNHLLKKAPDHFHMILQKGQMQIPDGQGGNRDAYNDLPGLAVLIGGMWIVNLNYWGCNQYITQRALGAKDLHTARSGILFAAFLKLLMPVIVVIPGIAAYVLFQENIGSFSHDMLGNVTLENKQVIQAIKPDKAYPVLLKLLPIGLKGLAFAALTAAIVASLAGKANSIATIFTLDIYKSFINKEASERQLVRVGKITVWVSFAIALLVAPALGRLDQAFQYIQEYTGFISPGVFAIFSLGFFWKRTTSFAALTAALLTIPLSAILKFFLPELPFINRMGWVYVILVALMVIISLADPKSKNNPKGLAIEPAMFRVSPGFAAGALIATGIIAGLYTVFW
jgi:SSS family solute:Na+ symporter